MMIGKFIVFEGIDGCGKTTQMMKAASYLFRKDKKIELYLTKEPTRDFEEIKEKMMKENDTRKDAEWYAQMFVKDRINHLEKYIKPNLEKGINVLCDRYKHSTLAYQYAQGFELYKLIDMHKGLLVPDLTLIFDCPVKIAFKRRKAEGAIEVFDKDEEFQKELRENYLNLKKILYNENIVIVDGSKKAARVFKKVKAELDKIF